MRLKRKHDAPTWIKGFGRFKRCCNGRWMMAIVGDHKDTVTIDDFLEASPNPGKSSQNLLKSRPRNSHGRNEAQCRSTVHDVHFAWNRQLETIHSIAGIA